MNSMQRFALLENMLQRYNVDEGKEGLAFVVTNDEALELMRGMMFRQLVPVGMVAGMQSWLAAGEGWQVSGRLKFFGRHLVVTRT